MQAAGEMADMSREVLRELQSGGTSQASLMRRFGKKNLDITQLGLFNEMFIMQFLALWIMNILKQKRRSLACALS